MPTKKPLPQRILDALCNIRTVENMAGIPWVNIRLLEPDVKQALVFEGLCEWKRNSEDLIIGVYLTDDGREAADRELERRSPPRG